MSDFTPETAPTFEMMQESVNDRVHRRAMCVPCPYCGAVSGVSCVTATVRPSSRVVRDRAVPHVARYRAWRGRRRALAAALAVAESRGWTQTPEPNTDYRMRNHMNGKTYNEGRVRVIKVETLHYAKTGGFRFWFYPLDGRDGTSDGLTANLEAVGGPWARTFEKLENAR